MKRLLYIVLLLLPLSCIWAQQLSTTIVGEVYDELTNQPIGNVNLSIAGTNYGTSTGDDGIFCIKANLKRKATLVVSCIGYKTKNFKIEPGKSVAIDVALRESTTELADVFVLSGANPARELMIRVRDQRKDHLLDTLHRMSRADEDTYVYLSGINAITLHQRLWRGLKFAMIPAEDSTYLLPLYSSAIHNGEREVDASVLSKEDYDELLSSIKHLPDFYQNTLDVYTAAFLSPLAANGNQYYRYVVTDSFPDSTCIYPNGRPSKIYRVKFRAKDPFYPLFNGEMDIDSLTCSLRYIQATAPQLVAVNYLRGLTFTQHFTPYGAGSRMTSSEANVLLDISVLRDTSHTFPSVLITHHAYQSADTTLQRSVVISEEDAQHHELISAQLDTLRQTPIFRVAQFAAYAIRTGYIPTGSYVEVGPIPELCHTNNLEGIRLGVPLRTSEKLMKHVCLNGVLGYGFKDHAIKGRASIQVDLPTKRRHILELSYSDDYTFSELNYFNSYDRENAIWFKSMGVSMAISHRAYEKNNPCYESRTRQQLLMLSSTNDWTDILEQDFYISTGRTGYDEPTTVYGSQDMFRHTTIGTTFRIGLDERKVDFFFRRIHVYGRLPIIYLGAEVGSYQVDPNQPYGIYGQFNLMVRQQVPLGIMGRLNYIFKAGIILGSVPYPMLNIFEGNQSYAYDPYRFTLMHNYEYGADRFLSLQAEWNGKGCLFNLIPGIRYLKLRELATFKIAWGGLSDRHRDVLAYPYKWHLYNMDDKGNVDDVVWEAIQPLNTPYIEMGVGIGNILRVLEIHSIWRLTHRDAPTAPNWAIRFRITLDN